MASCVAVVDTEAGWKVPLSGGRNTDFGSGQYSNVVQGRCRCFRHWILIFGCYVSIEGLIFLVGESVSDLRLVEPVYWYGSSGKYEFWSKLCFCGD